MIYFPKTVRISHIYREGSGPVVTDNSILNRLYSVCYFYFNRVFFLAECDNKQKLCYLVLYSDPDP